MSQREAMSSIDTAWLRMDRGTNRMMIVGVMTTERRLAYERFQQVIAPPTSPSFRNRRREIILANSCRCTYDSCSATSAVDASQK